MARLRLYLDEDVRPLLAKVLRERGYDVVSAIDMGRIGVPNADHFRFAASEERILVTFNIRDFVPLARKSSEAGIRFPGIVVSDQIPFRELLRRALRMLSSCTAENVAGSVVWLSDFR